MYGIVVTERTRTANADAVGIYAVNNTERDQMLGRRRKEGGRTYDVEG